MSKVGTAVVQLYREARRRKVFRTAALYVVGAWLALQVANVVFPGFAIPDAAIRALVWAAVAGFPIALVFGWLFEIGAGGIRRTLPVGSADLHQSPPLARRDYLILAAFAAIAAVLVVRAVQEVRETPLADSPPAAAGTARTGGERLPNSIAVLPFVNISNDPDNDYFCDGISEEILNALSGFRELNVIGRTSSFAFKGSDAGIDRISAVLGVSHVLQGSVRKAGNRLRISAQLLDHTGRQLWTETFDRELANVFDIQEEIAQAVATTAASRVVSRPAVGYHPNLEAYDHYLAGRELLHRREMGSALEELQRAIDLDPAFAEAHAEWAIGRLIGDPSAEDLEAGRAAIERALELQPKLLRAQAARGLLLMMSRPPDPEGAETVLRGVLEQDPNMSDALLWLANALRRAGAAGRGARGPAARRADRSAAPVDRRQSGERAVATREGRAGDRPARAPARTAESCRRSVLRPERLVSPDGAAGRSARGGQAAVTATRRGPRLPGHELRPARELERRAVLAGTYAARFPEVPVPLVRRLGGTRRGEAGPRRRSADSRRPWMRTGSTSRSRVRSSRGGMAHCSPARAGTPRRLRCWSRWLARRRSRSRAAGRRSSTEGTRSRGLT